jgi:hypothetical protein
MLGRGAVELLTGIDDEHRVREYRLPLDQHREQASTLNRVELSLVENGEVETIDIDGHSLTAHRIGPNTGNELAQFNGGQQALNRRPPLSEEVA